LLEVEQLLELVEALHARLISSRDDAEDGRGCGWALSQRRVPARSEKGATGRDADNHQRLEEHGIHGFCNFYFNTFALMRAVYAALEPSDRKLLPFARIDQAFGGSSRAYALAARQPPDARTRKRWTRAPAARLRQTARHFDSEDGPA
jgi:hypothetical protein